MLKRFTSLLFFSLVGIINLGHSIVPHTHSGQHEHHGNHDHDNHSDTYDTADEGIFHLFSHFGHAPESFTNTKQEEIRLTAAAGIISDYNTVKSRTPAFFSGKPAPETVFRERWIEISPHLISLTFRGPPVKTA